MTLISLLLVLILAISAAVQNAFNLDVPPSRLEILYKKQATSQISSNIKAIHGHSTFIPSKELNFNSSVSITIE